ncbi:Oidioi.mRNA.OKI2018_I69.chr1.g647.t1.cds [Oikopleura dioica]|uniref:Oidioi.mRNA.OKI2018_I69.chr1.g647.t1.cds n=1 Tax=Oikopleura dioica TaxID=34765 RepID=A0ABN7SM79_OIKDI|nr:Oidioi.mRNA.OKI2018_I69.chr1.g647.t1.cds [Oikopleura dioica]
MRFGISLRNYSIRLDPRKFKIAEKSAAGELSIVSKIDLGVQASIPYQIKMTGENGKPFYFAGQIHAVSKKNLVGIAGEIDEGSETGFIYDEKNEDHLGDLFNKDDLSKNVFGCETAFKEVEYDLVFDGSSEKAVIHSIEGQIQLT